ncbi:MULTISPECIES: hypothetical protein [Rhizobium]|uniref:hypothetical protein n=1 Tax=Rhizobium TaxID=379 RepID=UPI0007EAB02C|nr:MULTISPECIES: hypothetical protein [Rhizobium]ANK86883.1 hypothetical protein AMK02_CH03336 [Rhizobium sp. N731]ANK92837.1 hypothetical protein AMK01_CH03416 [Rhizobium sp. N6212]ANK98884.1 hypothetical protein AMK00_CH03420 [Rhizobium sp. N621]ANL05012.1 hypothetical protein AMJ99_CH03496 [Rhizobium esperanzae]ANL11069.1 hypothetical protein AMJ98_CH03447 [Rhizobium sp. N1341]
MRTLPALAGFLSILLPAIAFAQTANMRAASEAEIRQHLPGTSELKESSNGYEYREGSKNGYKINNGEVCVRFPDKSTDCVNVKTDGKNFQMIDRKGGRTRF